MAHPFQKNTLLDEMLQPRKMAFIVNPKAGTRLQRSVQNSLEKHLNHTLFEYKTFFTEYSGHATVLAHEAVEQGFEIVVAVGGDGSINEVAAALIHSKATLGIIPAGSGNGLAMHLGYGRDIATAIKKLNFATERRIDCGKMNDHYFFNLAGLGFDGLVSNLMQGQEKRGFSSYFMKSVEAGFQYEPKHCIIETPEKTIEIKCFAVTVANGPMYGYNFKIAPDARLNDGLFEVVILKDAPKWQYFAALPATLKGDIYEAEFVEHFQASKVTIKCAGENYAHLDGEGMKIIDEMRFEIVPSSLKILVPQSED